MLRAMVSNHEQDAPPVRTRTLLLLDNAFLQIFGKVHLADTFSGIFGCYLSHVMANHQLYKLLEGSGHWIHGSTSSPAGEFLGFARFLSLPKDTLEVYFTIPLLDVF